VLVQGLSTGHKVGLALAAAGFAGFSLIASMLLPRWRPQFPGRGLGFFVVLCVLLFAGMVTAVVIFGRESEEKAEAAGGTEPARTTEPAGTSGPAGTTAPGKQTVKVGESEWKISLPQTTFSPGTYSFDVSNDGKVEHDLTVQGPGGKEATPLIPAGKTASVTVKLEPGTYDFFCAVPGHKQLGMDQKVTVS
jgi:uncharacterized cupredoxin-like copper-binding protein